MVALKQGRIQTQKDLPSICDRNLFQRATVTVRHSLILMVGVGSIYWFSLVSC